MNCRLMICRRGELFGEINKGKRQVRGGTQGEMPCQVLLRLGKLVVLSVLDLLSVFPQPEPMRHPCRRDSLDERPVRPLLLYRQNTKNSQALLTVAESGKASLPAVNWLFYFFLSPFWWVVRSVWLAFYGLVRLKSIF